jgi:hypothetical protein
LAKSKTLTSVTLTISTTDARLSFTVDGPNPLCPTYVTSLSQANAYQVTFENLRQLLGRPLAVAEANEAGATFAAADDGQIVRFGDIDKMSGLRLPESIGEG